jgi:alpha-tubulin suppressor-like RCC1 family protein
VGDNATVNRSSPVTIPLTSGLMGIAGGDGYTLYAKWDGTVWAWGSNTYGQLGDGSPLRRLTPVPVKNPSGAGYLSSIVSVSVGTNYSLALASNGSVFAWGQNNYGQLGDGTTTNRLLPVQIPSLNGIVAISAGATHALALRFDGKVYAWGRNHLGQLGDGTQTDRLIPVKVLYLDNAVSIAAGANHSLAVHQDGSAYAWGNGEDGQLCDYASGSGYFSPIISQIAGIVGSVSVAAGTSHSLLLDVHGTAWACGDNLYGQLGNGSTTDSSQPVIVANLSNAARIAAGGNTSAALNTSGAMYAWGRNDYGQLGDGTTLNRTTIYQIPGVSGVAALAIGTSHTMTAKTNGSAYSWGRNHSGQIGDGSLTNRPSPTAALLP